MFEPLKERWRASGTAARMVAVLLVVGVVALTVMLSVWALRNDDQVLFSELDTQDAGAIVKELERLKVPYRLANDGTTVLVDKDAVHQTRLKVMSKEGVNLKGSVGFEIFNNADFGMTDFAQRINYQRALQGELARTIMSLEEIKHARVHLVLPESGVFKRSAVKPKASITVIERGETTLRPEQVAGIQRLVAAAVPELDSSAVTVLDQKGVVLSKAVAADADAEAAGARLDLKRQTELYFTRKVVSILEKAYGPGQAIVSVDVTLDYDHTKVTREDVLPLASRDGEPVGAVTRKRQTSASGRTGFELETTNTITEGKETSPKPARAPSSSNIDVEYQSGRRVEQVVSTPGGIRRLSVGVMIPDGADALQAKRLTEVISMAIGLDVRRGDAISVLAVDTRRASPLAAVVPGGISRETPGTPPQRAGDRPSEAKEDATGAIVTLLAVLCLIVIAVLVGWGAMYRPRRERLEPAERDRVLAELRNWVQQH